MLVSSIENASAKVIISWRPTPPSLSLPFREVPEAKAHSFPITLRRHVAVAARPGKRARLVGGPLRSLSDQKVADVISVRRICVAAAGPAADRPPEEEAALL